MHRKLTPCEKLVLLRKNGLVRLWEFTWDCQKSQDQFRYFLVALEITYVQVKRLIIIKSRLNTDEAKNITCIIEKILLMLVLGKVVYFCCISLYISMYVHMWHCTVQKDNSLAQYIVQYVKSWLYDSMDHPYITSAYFCSTERHQKMTIF